METFHNFLHFYKVCQKYKYLIFNVLQLFFKFGTLFNIYKGEKPIKTYQK